MWLSGGALVNTVPTKTRVPHKECWITLQQPRSSMWKPRWEYRSSVSNSVLLVYGPKNWGDTHIPPSGSSLLILLIIWSHNFSARWSQQSDSLWVWSENTNMTKSSWRFSGLSWCACRVGWCVGSYCQARGGIDEVSPETFSLQDRADLLRSIYKLDKRGKSQTCCWELTTLDFGTASERNTNVVVRNLLELWILWTTFFY